MRYLYHSKERKHIFETVFQNYTVNENTLLKYPSRKAYSRDASFH
ncbi:DUF6577 family protein [Dysgonomonas sp.]